MYNDLRACAVTVVFKEFCLYQGQIYWQLTHVAVTCAHAFLLVIHVIGLKNNKKFKEENGIVKCICCK